ncbi:MAG: SGNH/GDSL hydrolase family protein [Bacteroidetes bacterium]|nr:SGNH/GDSL hydrolase family protein [Bacteroidota bacterium]
MSWKYHVGKWFFIPLLPIMYVQGKRIKERIPGLPEAQGSKGSAENGHDRTIQLLTIGESTIAGVGVDTHQDGFTGTLARTIADTLPCNVRWRVYAKSGYTADRVREKLIPLVEETHVDLIVIGIGGNDAFKLRSPGKWKRDVTELLKALRLRFPSPPIVFINMPPVKAFPAFTSLMKASIGNLVEILGEELEELIKDWPGVHYYALKLNLKDWISRMNIEAEPSEFFSDGVHPSKLTYQIWAKDMAQFILSRSVLSSQDGTGS